MGRGGGGGSRGGSSHSSGSRGGSYRSSGGGGRGGRSYSSSHHSSSSSYHVHRHYYGGYRSGGSTTLGKFVALSVLLIFIAIWIFGVVLGTSGNITMSTVERTPLSKQYTNSPGVGVRDSLGWVRSKAKVEKGLNHYFDKTGVAPYLVLIEDLNGDYYPSGEQVYEYAVSLYDELFTDEAHLLFVFQCKDEGTQYNMAAVTGSMAKTVADDEALEILYDYMDSYFWSDKSEDAMFADAFSSAADRMMKVSKNPVTVAITWVGIVAALFAILLIMDRIFKRRHQRAQEVENILNSPIPHLPDD